MHLETQPVLKSARILQQSLMALSLALILACAVLIGWTVFDTRAVGATFSASVGYPEANLSRAQSVALGSLVLTQMIIWLATVLRGRQIFLALSASDPRAASHAASQVASLLWIMLLWGIVAHMLGTVITTWNFPEGQRALSLSIGSAQITTVFAALLATFTSRAFVLGAALWQDHNEVI